MEDKIAYQNWPQTVKVTTALSTKKFLIKSPAVAYIFGYLIFIGSILGLIYNFIQNSDFSFWSNHHNLASIIMGFAIIVEGNSIRWVANNSSWEERFNHKSSLTHKVIYILITLVLIGCLFSIIFIPE